MSLMQHRTGGISLARLAPIVVVIGVAFTSLSAILIRLGTAPPLTTAAYRMLFAVLMTWPLWYWTDATPRVARSARGPGMRLSRRTVALLILSGLFLSLHFGAWFSAVRRTSVLHATVLVATHPLLVMGASMLFLGERPSQRGLLGILLALGGSAILASGSTSGGIAPTMVGNLLAVIGAAAVAGYLVVGRQVRPVVRAQTYNLIVYGTAGVVIALAALLSGQSMGPFAPREYLIFAGLALFCTLLGHSLFNWALGYVRPALVSVSIVLEPVFATAIALPLFGEVPSIATGIGALVTVGGILLLARES